MNRIRQQLVLGLVGTVLCVAAVVSHAAPGAHGPNGEHLDGPVAANAVAGAAPRFEAKSEAFEMVGRLQNGELGIFVNRYESNEPVLNATLEIELGPQKATARFRPEQGDYVVADKAFIDVLRKPGDHALVLLLNVGADADLLDAQLRTAGAASATVHQGERGHTHGLSELTASLAIIGGAVVLGGIGWIYQRRRQAQVPDGAQQ